MEKKKPWWKRIVPTILSTKEKRDNTGPKEMVNRALGLKIKF